MNPCACALELSHVTRHNRQPVVQCSGGDKEVGLRIGMAPPASLLDKQPPFDENILADRQRPTLEHRPHLMRQPLGELDSPDWVRREFDSEADFR